MSQRSAFKLLSLVVLLSLAIQPIAPVLAQQTAPAPSVAPAPAETPQPAAPVEPVAQAAPAATNALADAVRMGKWPAQVAASTGAIRPNVHGPQRTDPAEGIPAHAYSPFDERHNREYPCPTGGCEFETDYVLVKLAPDVDAGAVSDASAMTDDTTLNSTLSDAGVMRLEPLFPKAQVPKDGALIVTPNGERAAEPDLTRWYRAYLSPTTGLAAVGEGATRAEESAVFAAVEALSAEPGVAWAEPDYLRKPVGEPRLDSLTESAASAASGPSSAAAGPAAFTDPLYAQQWHLGAAHVPEAWQWLSDHGLPPGGSRDIVVAVIDTGVSYTHPDLAANMWVNAVELNGISNFDDDGNGYKDDIYGADTVAPDGNPVDDHGHGTHVAGIIAAQANNGIGGVGVAYNVQIMAIKAAQYSGVLSASDIAEGVYYAVQKGADIINMSFGGYAHSQVEEDALSVAFGQAVLVAAAGNDGKVNLPCKGGRDMYPAAYNWVLGVMARNPAPDLDGNYLAGFSNRDCSPQDSHEYELMAPGVDIWSTLPGGQYAAWDGTSMSAPVVSGIAALLRTKWSDRSAYSSRFIMGQVAETGGLQQAYILPGPPPVTVFYQVPDAIQALGNAPRPSLTYLQHWTFDTTEQSPGNDGDGIVDAGETVDLGIVIRNHWGKADPVSVVVDAWAEGAVSPDPYVTMVSGTVDYGAVGTFAQDDNGLRYGEDGVAIGVDNPFRFTVSPFTPNDHVIPFRIRMSAGNGYDPTDPSAPYTFESRFILVVQRGEELPRVIEEDMTLGNDKLWLIPDSTLIEPGVTVTVEPGTQIQFWTDDPSSPYSQTAAPYLQVEGNLIVQGTAQAPVELYNSQLKQGHAVWIKSAVDGEVDLTHAHVQNPILQEIDAVDHCRFSQDVFSRLLYRMTQGGDLIQWRSIVSAISVRNSSFKDLGDGTALALKENTICNQFEGTLLHLSDVQLIQDNVFMRTKRCLGSACFPADTLYYVGPGHYAFEPTFLKPAFPVSSSGRTYVAVAKPYLTPSGTYLDLAEAFAAGLGGHVVSVSDEQENLDLTAYRSANFTQSSFQSNYGSMVCSEAGTGPSGGCWELFSSDFILGLDDRMTEGTFRWVGREPVTYTNWAAGQPDNGGCVGSCTGQDYTRLFGNATWSDEADVTGPVVLELPEGVTAVQIEAERQMWIQQNPYNPFQNNAILNPWWNPDLSEWMKFTAKMGRGYLRYATGNYWGTTSTSLIDLAIWDYSDNFNYGRMPYQPILTTPPVTAYPFVVDVTLQPAGGTEKSTLNGPTPEVGAKHVTFKVTFNRDMDTAIQPAVSFGPAEPYTDYTIPGAWVDARTWQGALNVKPTTGDGYQLIRVAGAVAADDPWLVTGDDAGRFRFEVITSGTEAMNLQATGGEGGVDLVWMQDDFDLLAGYNLYRSTAQTGTYTRVNSTIIPPEQKSWRDTNVTPGIPYYYKFTVVKSDMTESGFSNVATGTPLDTIPPVISHTPATSATPGLPLTLFADVTDNVVVQDVILYYRAAGTTPYASQAMVLTTGNRYSATIAGAQVAAPGIEYYIEATDGISTLRAGRPEAPNPVTVVDRPVVTAISPNRGPTSGGTTVTIAGSNFKAGATSTIGGAICGSLAVVSANQITCVTPTHFPAAADVVVTNSDSQSGTLLRGFTFESDTASLSLPATGGEQGAVVQIPINAANVNGLTAASLTVTFDAAVLSARAATTGSLTPGWGMVANTTTPGQVRLSMASTGGAMAGSGVLAYIEFEVTGTAGTSSALTLANVSLNDGAIPVDTATGSFAVNAVYSVAGTVRFWNGDAGVPGVALTLTGDRLYAGLSDTAGAYTVSGARSDDYTLTPSKSDGANGISAYDASLALQHDAGLITLAGYPFTAGDVNQSGAVTSMDAFYILQKAVDLITLPFPGAGIVWAFAPGSRDYTNLGANQTGQDFTTVLLGDISGNWSASLVAASMETPAGTPSLYLRGGRPDAAGFVTATLYLDSSETPVYSLDLILGYDASTISAADISAGAGAAGALVQTNLAEPGIIHLALAAASPLASGQAAALPLASLRFRLLDPTTRVGLTLRAGVFNESTTDLDWHAQPLNPIPVYLPLLVR